VSVVVANPAGVGVVVTVDVTVAVMMMVPDGADVAVDVVVAETDGDEVGVAVAEIKIVAAVVSVDPGAGVVVPPTGAVPVKRCTGTSPALAVAIASPAILDARITTTARRSTHGKSPIGARFYAAQLKYDTRSLAMGQLMSVAILQGKMTISRDSLLPSRPHGHREASGRGETVPGTIKWSSAGTRRGSG